MQPPYRDQEVLDLLASRIDSVKLLLELILKKLVPRGKFTADEVWGELANEDIGLLQIEVGLVPRSELPRDLDLYLALSILEERGNIRALYEDDGFVPQDKMVYEASK